MRDGHITRDISIPDRARAIEDLRSLDAGNGAAS
jgi:hypothetical protein